MAKRSTRQKHLDRLYRQISRMEKRGYRFAEGFKESLKEKSTQSLSHLKAEWLYKQAEYAFDPETGEIMPVQERRKQENVERAKKSAETKRKKQAEEWTQVVLYNLFEMIDAFNAEPVKYVVDSRGKKRYRRPQAIYEEEYQKQKLLDAIHAQIEKYGENAVAQIIYDNYAEVSNALDKLQYSYHEAIVADGGTFLLRIIMGNGYSLSEIAAMTEIDEHEYEDYEGEE